MHASAVGRQALELTVRLTSARSVRYVRDLVRALRPQAHVPAGGLGVGDLGADAGGVESSVVAGGPGESCGLAQEGLKGGERVAVPVPAGIGGNGDAGVVVVAAGAVVAAEHPVPAASDAGRDGVAATGPFTFPRSGCQFSLNLSVMDAAELRSDTWLLRRHRSLSLARAGQARR